MLAVRQFDDHTERSEPPLMGLYFKKYDPTMMTQGLKWPSETVVAFVEQGAEMFNTAIARHVHE